MITKEAITLFKYYLQSNHKQRTIESYSLLLERFEMIYSQRDMETIAPDEIFHFLENLTKDMAKSTRRLRYAQLKAFYNFIIDRCSLNMRNPCSMPLLSKSFRAPKQQPHKILDRETVDEMIYNTKKQRDRLILRIPTQVATRFRFIPPPDSDLSRHRIPKHFATPWEVRKGRWI
ncbi:MAG: site-specific integrase, partial [Fibrobacter sp.]|nr:site-specific integrase [Fibrobacter sp.]